MLAALLAPAVSAQAASISVNLVDSLTTTEGLIGPTSAAESDQLAGATGYNVGYWNELLVSAAAGTLLDSTGSTVSGLSVTLNGGGNNANWSVGNFPAGNNRNLMWGALGNGATVTGIPYASYDLVIYNLPDSILFGPQSSSVTLTIGATSTTVGQAWAQGQRPNDFITFDVTGNPGGTFSASNANTIIFKGLTASDISFAGFGNGFQIVDVTPGGSPTITTAGTLVAVPTTFGTPSTPPTQFTVSGTDLTAGITVTPPTGYEVSVSASSGYAGSGTAITVGIAPTVSTTTIYVRLAATASVAGSPYSGNIVCSSPSANPKYVATVASTVTPSGSGGTYSVGDTGPGGGIVFYANASIYLEAAPSTWGSDTTGRTWATDVNDNRTTAVPGGTGTAIGTGYANSVAIANQAGNVAPSCAAVVAREYTGGGLTDWFLPSKDEVLQLYAQRVIAGLPEGQLYWTSSEVDADNVWGLWDNGSTVSFLQKGGHELRVRPIRMGANGAAPTITTAGTLVAVDTTSGTPSTPPTQFTVSGTDLTAGITVTPPTGYEVSVSAGSGYAGSGTAIIVGIAPTVSTTTIYVRLAATASVAGSPYSGDIVCSSPSAASQNVATVASTVTPSGGTPTITTTGTLVAVPTTVGTPSPTPTQFTVSGTDLEAGITVTPPAGYEVSVSAGSGYAGSGTAITVGIAPTVSTTTIYVRLAATANVAGSPYSGDIVCSSPSAASKNVATVASTVSKASQASITFAPLSPQVNATVQALSASGGSGSGAFSYAVQSGPGTISGGNFLTATANTGTIVVRATKAADDNYNEATRDANVVADPGSGGTYSVGMTGPGGGIVFYANANIYLEAAPSNWGSDTTYRTWATDVNGNPTTTVPGGATATAIGTGYANSAAIANQAGNVAPSCAAVVAREYTGGGLTDWFLPSKDEVLQLYAKRAFVGLPEGQLYWSSSEVDADQAWGLWDNGSTVNFLTKGGHTLRVRPIRMASNGGLRFTGVSYDANNDQLTLKWDSSPGATYTIENTQGFAGNGVATWDNLTTGIASGGITTTRVIDAPAPGTFYRIRKE